MDKQPWLALDLDETLVSSSYANNEKHADQLLDTYGQLCKGQKFQISNDGWYVSFIRSWSIEVIDYYHRILGYDNVGICSIGVNDYVGYTASHLGLNIKPSNIFGREDLCHTVPKFKDYNIVLVDNCDWYHHNSNKPQVNKVKFLNNLAIKKLVQVPEFDVRYFDDIFEISAESLFRKIDRAFAVDIH